MGDPGLMAKMTSKDSLEILCASSGIRLNLCPMAVLAHSQDLLALRAAQFTVEKGWDPFLDAPLGRRNGVELGGSVHCAHSVAPWRPGSELAVHLHMSARGTLKISDDFWASPKPFFLARPATTGL